MHVVFDSPIYPPPLLSSLSELKLSVSVSLMESIIEEVLQDLSVAQQKLVCSVSRMHTACVHAFVCACDVCDCVTSNPAFFFFFQEKHLKEYSQPVNSKTNVPQLRVVEQVFPTDEVS